MSSDIEKEFAEVNGTRLYYEVAGMGEPLVLIHGLFLNNKMWDDQFSEFSKQFKVIRYDMRGYGKSSNPKEEEPYSNHEDLKALLDYLNTSKAHILGLSLGGSNAINFTLEYPENVTSLTLADPHLNGFNYSKEFLIWITSLFRLARETSLEAALDTFLEGALFNAAMMKPSVAVKMRDLVSTYSGWKLLNNDPVTETDPPASDRLSEISCPVLVLVGEQDIMDYRSIADKIASEVPNVSKCVIKDVGHMSNMEDPETFNKEVLSFLSSL
jgi:pimeloyl-ACP methyl ester carboxylesterase